MFRSYQWFCSWVVQDTVGYGEELKQTNPSSTIQIEGLGPTFKVCYIYSRASKEGFTSGWCMPRLIWMDAS